MTLRRNDVASANLGVALVTDETIAELNGRFLAHPGPTDVLTFCLADHETDAADEFDVEGEIVASVETAERESLHRDHAVESELALYVVHGTLHLLGYNDGDRKDAERMHREEDDILDALGLGRVYRSKSSPRREPPAAVNTLRSFPRVPASTKR